MECWSIGYRNIPILPITPLLHYSNTPSLHLSTELSQKPEIILKKQPDIVDTVFQHGDALHAHAEGEAGNFFRIVADEFENRRIDHAGAEDFQPAGPFADMAPLTFGTRARTLTKEAMNINFSARFGEWEKTRPEPHSSLLVKNLL